jgi:hypothetical protein
MPSPDDASPQLPATRATSLPSSARREAERKAVGVIAKMILDQFWREDEGDAEKAFMFQSWMDVLQGCTLDEMRAAWADYQRTGPRTAAGKLYRPDPGALWLRIDKAREPERLAKALAAREVDLQAAKAGTQRLTDERRAEIIREVCGDGETPQCLAGIVKPKRFPGEVAAE